jgi:dGTPase
LEPKAVDAEGKPRGLNLTRASLLATMKYPWDANTSERDVSGREKFGFYEDDREVFEWATLGSPGRALSVEAQIMDFSDDVAYSVHDFEDAIVNGFIEPDQLGQPDHRDQVLHALQAWGYPHSSALGDAWDRLESVPGWLRTFTPHREELANLKNLTSTLIGRFAETATISDDGKTLAVAQTPRTPRLCRVERYCPVSRDDRHSEATYLSPTSGPC